MSINSAIDLSQLPKPDVVETLDFEVIFARQKEYLLSKVKPEIRDEIAETLELESEPITILAQSAAYREMMLRQRINDAARAVMLAYAEGADLDQIAANYDVERLVIMPEDTTTFPATLAVMEDDASLRRRTQMSFEGFTTAGSSGSYVFHALSADARVLDADAFGPPETPGVVEVAVLSRNGVGTAENDLIQAVTSKLSATKIRPLTDQVLVKSAAIISYAVEATLTFYDGPDQNVVMQAANDVLENYINQQHRLGRDVSRSGIFAALHRDGVHNVVLTQPATDVVVDWDEASYCTSVNLINGGLGE
ncbi:MAG: baseplate assembly protein [Alcaligenaceae bacterium]|nr:baseplate assembly protein [Alcaligenaceae bacterium]